MHGQRSRASSAVVAALGLSLLGASAALADTTEFNIIPIIGGDSDVGVGFGQVGDWARLGPAYTPYKWRLETNAFITFKPEFAKLVIPFQDYFVVLSLPNVGPRHRARLDIRPAFTDEATLKFYGFGNATPFPAGVPTLLTEYGRLHPTLLVEARVDLVSHLYSRVGSVSTFNWLRVPAGGTVAAAAVSPSPEVRSLMGPDPFAAHGVQLIEVGIEFDNRDDEVVTHDGQFHTIEARLSPAIGKWLPYAYQQIDGTFRFYNTLVPRHLSVSVRLVGDLLLGSPPFYELARYDETPAIGGGKAIRGVPAQRYYGKVKVFENFEVRSDLLDFTVKKKLLVLGLAGFVDAGRVWTQLGTPSPELDGTGLGIHYGVGGGLRLAEGKTFVVRADVAWSPDAMPIGAYFAAGEIF
jgi:hypothetical protein